MGSLRIALPAALAAVLAAGCSDGGRHRGLLDDPPVLYGVAIAPSAPRTADDLTVTWEGYDPEGQELSVTYAWRRNGARLPDWTGPTLPAGETAKGDVITVVVEVSDGAGPVQGEARAEILDTLPVVAMSPPAEVAHGEVLAFAIEAYDADGDPVGLSLAYAPAGMTIAGEGAVRWTASPPMFGPALDVRFGIAVAGIEGVALAGSVRVTDRDRPYPLRRTGLDRPVRFAGLRATDLDGDGRAELLVTSPDGVHELRSGPAGWEVAWTHPFLEGWDGGLASAAAADLDGDGHREIFLSSGWGLRVLDGASRRAVAGRPFGACRDLEAADLDGDGDVELVCLASASLAWDPEGRIVVLDAATFAVAWASDPYLPGFSLALGDVDGDGVLEIVSGGGTVHDGRSFEVEWALEGGFGASVATGDLDGDGVEEILAAGDGGTFRGFDAVARSTRFVQDGFDEDEVLAADLDGDGRAEIVLGEGQWGDVVGHRFDAQSSTAVEIFRLDKQGWGVAGLAAGDLDGDGAVELAWGTQGPPVTPAAVAIAGPDPSWRIEWIDAVQLEGPYAFGGWARLGGGVEALLFATGRNDGGYGPARLVALDPATGAVRVTGAAGSELLPGTGVVAADVDGDGVDEAIGIASPFVDTYLISVDLLADAVEWTSPVLDHPAFGWGTAVTQADVNLDGVPDLVAFPSEIRVFDVRNGALLWSSSGFSQGVDVVAVDLSGDPVPELVAASPSRVALLAWTGTGYAVAAARSVADVLDLAAGDCDGDGAPEIYVLAGSTLASTVHRLGPGLEPLGSFTLPVQARGLFVEDLPAGRRNLVLSVAADVIGTPAHRLEGVDARTGEVVWRSPAFPGTPGRNSLGYVDVDGDGEREIAFGTERGMFVTR